MEQRAGAVMRRIRRRLTFEGERNPESKGRRGRDLKFSETVLDHHFYSTGTSYSLPPSVLNSTTTASALSSNTPSAQTFLNAANVAAPHGPASTPLACNSPTHRCASPSVTVAAANVPSLNTGHAMSDVVPQFMPHMILSPVTTDVMLSQCSDSLKDAAVSGSTVTTLLPGLLAAMECAVTACAQDPTPTEAKSVLGALPFVCWRTWRSVSWRRVV